MSGAADTVRGGTAAPRAALVREPAGDPGSAELTHRQREPVDTDRLRSQHRAYVAALAGLGLEVVEAPPLPDHPDAPFVEDVVVVVDDLAILTRPGAATRRGEVASVAPLLAERGLRVVTLPAGTLDGGDVLQVGDVLGVGRSTRSDDAGRATLAALVAPLGRRVVDVAITGALHLKTAVTLLPDGALAADVDAVDPGHLGREVVAVPESAGANVVTVGATAVVSASAPRTAALLRARGIDVVDVALDEVEKLEAGPTCCSVLLPR